MKPRTETCVGHYLLPLGSMLILDYEKGLIGLSLNCKETTPRRRTQAVSSRKSLLNNPKLFQTFQFQLGAVISSARLKHFILFDNFFNKKEFVYHGRNQRM